jgi:hypothetical protein
MTAKHIRAGFEPNLRMLPLSLLLPTKEVTEQVRRSTRFRCIAASIDEIGVIEPLVVFRQPDHRGRHLLLDGHIRRVILTESGQEDVECLLAQDDEAFTYNKRINRLAVVQEHFLIVRAIDRGISEGKLAKTLGVKIDYVMRRKALLKGISEQTIGLLKDKPVSPVVFDVLRKMKPCRQNEACRLMISTSTYSASYARALFAASPDSELTWPRRRPPPPIVTRVGLALMEEELKTAQDKFKPIETAYGNDMVGLVIATRYVANLLQRCSIVHFLEENHPEILAELRNILFATSTDQAQEPTPESGPGSPRGKSDRSKQNGPAFVPSRGRKWQRLPPSTNGASEPR